MDRAQQLSQKVEREVRQQLGDLMMQTIVLKSMLEMQGGEQQPAPPPQPKQPVTPPPEPEPKETETPPEHAASVSRGNGKANGQLSR